jgi:hypothetical protein
MADNPETYGRHSRAHARGLSVAELLRRVVARGEAIRLAWRGDAATNLADRSDEFPTAVLPVIRDDLLALEAQETEPTTATREAWQWLDTERFSWWPKPLAG